MTGRARALRWFATSLAGSAGLRCDGGVVIMDRAWRRAGAVCHWSFAHETSLPAVCRLPGPCCRRRPGPGDHTLVTYRAFESMPEVAKAPPVTVEPLEMFLKAQEPAIAELLMRQEQWTRTNMPQYAPRAATQDFKPDPNRSDDQRRLAFLTALRIWRPRFALYLQPDRRETPTRRACWRTMQSASCPSSPTTARRFYRIAAQDRWRRWPCWRRRPKSPTTAWTSTCGRTTRRLGQGLWFRHHTVWQSGPVLRDAGTVSHGFSARQDWLIYKAAPFIQRTYPLMRIQQYTSLASLAFRTGHAYWGWRFTGLALHYIQDLAQPYHADLAPGDSTLRLISANVLAMAGFP